MTDDPHTSPPDPTFLGFLFKRVVRRPPGWCVGEDGTVHAPAVELICSVSDCISRQPESKFERWAFNDAGCFETDDPGLASIPAHLAGKYTAFALDFFPLCFDAEAPRPITASEVFATDQAVPSSFPSRGTLPGSYRLLGYDIVNYTAARPARAGCAASMALLECSPLSCNAMAEHLPVNRFCLLDTWADVLVAAAEFSRGGAEPGPYLALGVHAAEPIVSSPEGE